MTERKEAEGESCKICSKLQALQAQAQKSASCFPELSDDVAGGHSCAKHLCWFLSVILLHRLTGDQ